MTKAIYSICFYSVIALIMACSSEKSVVQSIYLHSSINHNVKLTGNAILLLESFDDIRSTSISVKRELVLSNNSLRFEIPLSADLCHLGIQIKGYKPQIYNCEYFKYKNKLEVYPLPSKMDDFWPDRSIKVLICQGSKNKTFHNFYGTGLSSKDFWAELDESDRPLFKSKVPLNNYTADRFQELYLFKYIYEPAKELTYANYMDKGEFTFSYKGKFYKIIPRGKLIENKEGCQIYELLFNIERSENTEFYTEGYESRFNKFFGLLN